MEKDKARINPAGIVGLELDVPGRANRFYYRYKHDVNVCAVPSYLGRGLGEVAAQKK